MTEDPYGRIRFIEELSNELDGAYGRIRELEEALRRIAEQDKSEEMDETRRRRADFEGGYNACVHIARATLNQTGGRKAADREFQTFVGGRAVNTPFED